MLFDPLKGVMPPQREIIQTQNTVQQNPFMKAQNPNFIYSLFWNERTDARTNKLS